MEYCIMKRLFLEMTKRAIRPNVSEETNRASSPYETMGRGTSSLAPGFFDHAILMSEGKMYGIYREKKNLKKKALRSKPLKLPIESINKLKPKKVHKLPKPPFKSIKKLKSRKSRIQPIQLEPPRRRESYGYTYGTSAPSVDDLKDWIKGNPMKNKNVYVLTDPEERDDRKFIVKENVFTEDRKFYYYVNNELLQGLKHENLISFYGYIEESNLILTFFDYMPAGSLQDLYNQQGKIQESKCFNYAEQILKGLQYLHSRRIAHMNIRCETIVFETEDKLRIAGLSHIIIGRQMISSANYGKERWTAPEVFNEAHGHGFYDYQSDIWSLGCTVVEMLTAECPYAYEKYLPSVIITIGMGIPPETGQSLSIRMKNLLQKTLCADPFKRFGAKNILKILRSVEGDIYLPVDMNPSSSKAVIPKVVCIDPQGSTTTSKGSTKLKKGIGVYEM